MPSETATALIELAEAVASRIPANPESPHHKELARKLEREMAKYFNSLANAFPYGSLEKLYTKYVKPG